MGGVLTHIARGSLWYPLQCGLKRKTIGLWHLKAKAPPWFAVLREAWWELSLQKNNYLSERPNILQNSFKFASKKTAWRAKGADTFDPLKKYLKIHSQIS